MHQKINYIPINFLKNLSVVDWRLMRHILDFWFTLDLTFQFLGTPDPSLYHPSENGVITESRSEMHVCVC